MAQPTGSGVSAPAPLPTAGFPPHRGSALRGARTTFARTSRAWDRPLTAYYLIIGGSLLIMVLGLVMVFSASQIEALQNGLPSTFFFRKQLLAAAIGAVLLVAAARMPVRVLRSLAYPLLAGSIFLMVLVQVPGVGKTVNGNQNWLMLGGSFQIQP
ncbi:MAG: FtsW/RodA/SpoVE family cell cycle protein, partial [Streptomycetaceae bacterium]|nr:FtsW/RodA/SpoVE family cell cycle protein [Streptomycetaceae bacterium]